MTDIFHITTRSAWAAAGAIGQYYHPSLEAEGFIHCCRKDQMLRVANSLFRSKEDLIALRINPVKLKSAYKDDFNESGELYPHIYGTINSEAVSEVIDLEPASDGSFSWESPSKMSKEFVPGCVPRTISGNESQFQSFMS